MSDKLRVLVVDGYGAGAFLARRLRDNCAEVLHTRSSATPPAFYQNAFSAGEFDVDMGYRQDFSGLVGELRSLTVDRVVAATEPGVPLAERLTTALGLPGHEPKTVAARRNKYELGRQLEAAGLASARTHVVGSANDVIMHSSDLGSRVVVKPVESAGTDGVRFCNTAEEVAAAVAQVLAPVRNFLGVVNRAALLQEHVPGAEYYVNTVSDNGVHHVVECWKYKKRISDVGSPIYDFVVPVICSEPDRSGLIDYLQQSLTAIGVRNGPAHSEVIMSDRGPVLIDVGMRLCGGSLPQVVERYMGTSHPSATARWLVGRPIEARSTPRNALRSTRSVRHVFLINQVEGLARSENYVAQLRELKTCRALKSNLRLGHPARRTVDMATSPGYLYLVGAESDVLADYERIRQLEDAGLYTE